MPVQTRRAAAKTQQELLCAVLRLGKALGLDLQSFLRVRLACKAFKALADEHLTLLEHSSTDIRAQGWWRPAAFTNLAAASQHIDVLPDVPALRALTSLTLEQTTTSAPRDLRPLSVLHRLQELYVEGAATGLAALPALLRLEISPGSPEDLQALGRQSGLTWLRLAHDLGHEHSDDAPYRSHDFDGVLRLPNLAALCVETLHLGLLGNGEVLAACTALRNLQVGFWLCECGAAAEDAGGLAALTQLTRLGLGQANADVLETLDLTRLSRLQSLALDMAVEFGQLCMCGDCDRPRFRVPCLELGLRYYSWSIAVVILEDVYDAWKHWRDEGGSFDSLCVFAWPELPAPADDERAVCSIYRRFQRKGVRITSAAASVPGVQQPVQSFGLPGNSVSSESDSVSRSSSDSDGCSDND